MTPNLPVIVEIGQDSGAVTVDVQNLKAVLHFILDEMGSAFETLVGVLVEDGAMMLAGVFTALNHKRDQGEKLRIGVIGVIDVSRRL